MSNELQPQQGMTLQQLGDNVETKALAQIQEYEKLGLVIPEGFNPTNSLKKARIMLNTMTAKNGQPVLAVCTQESIIDCLVDSLMKGLDYSEKQVYFIPRGNEMTNLESIYGRIVRCKRASDKYEPLVNFVHTDDKFKFHYDLANGGRIVIDEHETELANLDKPIIAAYTYVTDNDGNTQVFIMTQKEWLTSWKKSANGASVAKEFERDMIYRTIIKKATKSLVNSSTKPFVLDASKAMDDDDDRMLGGERIPEPTDKDQQFTDYEEINDEQPAGEAKDPAPAPQHYATEGQQPAAPQKPAEAEEKPKRGRPKKQDNPDPAPAPEAPAEQPAAEQQKEEPKSEQPAAPAPAPQAPAQPAPAAPAPTPTAQPAAAPAAAPVAAQAAAPAPSAQPAAPAAAPSQSNLPPDLNF
jgi:recombinational DNA repair protein RecT